MDALISPTTGVAQHMGVVEALVSASKLMPPGFPMPQKITMDYLDQLLLYCVENRVEDLVLLDDEPLSVLWSDAVHRFPGRKIYLSELQELLCKLVDDPGAALRVARAEPCDFNYSVKTDRRKSIRFRCSATACLGMGGAKGLEIIFRPVGKNVPSVEELGVEQYIVDACTPSSGIVIVTGPTGSGKSTLLDSILRKLLTSIPAKRLLSFCSPIENDLREIQGLIGQVVQADIGPAGYGGHLKSYEEAVRNMLRRHPHAVYFGEARDKQTIEGAILSAMSSHLTYTTTHTSSTHMTLSRMADPFGLDRTRIIKSLIENTRLIVHQRLLPKSDGLGRVAIRSALCITNDMRDELMRATVDQVPVLMKEYTESHGLSLLKSAEQQFSYGNIHQRSLDAIEQELGGEVVA